MRLRIAYGTTYSDDEWRKHPTWEFVRARRLNQFFAAWKNPTGDNWSLTHIPSGFRATSADSLKEARILAAGLLKHFGERRWQFKNPEQARKLKGAATLILNMRTEFRTKKR